MYRSALRVGASILVPLVIALLVLFGIPNETNQTSAQEKNRLSQQCSPPNAQDVILYVEPCYNAVEGSIPLKGRGAPKGKLLDLYDSGYSSIYIYSGYSLQVFDNRDGSGSKTCLRSSDSDLSDNTFDDGKPLDDKIGSVIWYDNSTCSATSNPTATPTKPPTVPTKTPTKTPTVQPTTPTKTPTAQPTTPTKTPTGEMNWWNSSYTYRRPIVIPWAQDSGTIIQVDGLDLSTLVREGKALSNYSDVRVVKKISDTEWKEVPLQIYTNWDIQFKLDTSIDENDSSYYLYYGNPKPGLPTTFNTPPQGWWMEYYTDTYWEKYHSSVEFSGAIETDDLCKPVRDGGFGHNEQTGSCFDDSNKFIGRIFVPYTGDWTFAVYTVAGYKVTIHGENIGERDYNSGQSPAQWIKMRPINLKAGWHTMDLRISYVNSGPWKFAMEGPNYPFQVIPAKNYQRVRFHRYGVGVGDEEKQQSPPTVTPETPTVTPKTPTATPKPDDSRLIDVTISLYNNPNTSKERTPYEEIIRYFADGVYEQSNGAHKLRTVTIYRNREHFKQSHIQWLDKCWPNAHVSGYPRALDGWQVEMCDLFLDVNYLDNQEGGGYTLAHEWGHYFYGLYDEYRGGKPCSPQDLGSPCSTDTPVKNSIMNSHWNAKGKNYEWLNFSTTHCSRKK